MTYIHEIAEWPAFQCDDATLLPLLADVRHRQGRLQGRMESLDLRIRAEASLATLTADVIKSSAIAGLQLDAEAVRSSIALGLGLDLGGAAPVRREVEMMLDATQKYAEPLTVERLFGWHASLFPTGYSGMRRITVGAWRPAGVNPMCVTAGPAGMERVYFEAPSAQRMDYEMAVFLEWFEARNGLDPVLKAGVAHFWFASIHPFEDGNGRIGRAITDLALARSEGTPARFYSMSAQIEAEKEQYYLILEQSQRGTLNITTWLQWFLGCLGRAVDGAEGRLANVSKVAKIWERINQAPTNERQRTVIHRLLDGFEGKLCSSKYAKLAQCSADTALRDIKLLLDRGILVQEEGRGRSTSYRLALSPEEGARAD